MTTPSNDPYQLQRLLSRRSFLGLSGLGAAAVLGITLESASANPHGKGLARAAVQAQSADSGPHPPFALDSSCVLSEDHFLVKVGKIDPATDKVVAYTRPDGQVEAVLLQNEIISLVYRDPTTAGGWNSHEIAAGATDMVAGMASDKSMNLHLHVFYRTTSGQVRHLLQGPSSSDGTSSTQFTPVDTLNWSASGPLQITTDVMRNLLVFSFQPSSAPGKTDAHMDYYWTANGFHSFDSFTGTMSGFEFDKSSDQSHACAAVTFNGLNGWVFVFVPDAAHSTVRVYDKTLYNSNHSSGSGSVSSYGAKQPPSLAPASVLSVDHVTTNKYLNVPTAVVRTADQQLYTLTYNANDLGYTTWQQLTLPPGTDHSTPLVWEPSSVAQSSNWSTSGNLLNLFVVVKQTLSVIRQVNQGDAMKDEESPIFNPAVPLQTNVAIAASQARPSDGDELIVVDGDGNLEVLVRSMDGEWTANKIHLPATEAADVSTYRVQLTLSDDWGARMAGKALQVTASAPAVALLDGKGITLSSTPVTFTTDGAGHVTIPIVADGLWAPQLTVSGGGLSAPVTVSPSSPVNDYMTGTVTLNYLPAVTGDTLAGAATPSGTTVFPVAKQDKGAAADAATVLATAAAAGANPTLVGEVAPEARAQGLNGIGAHGVSKQMPSDAVTLGSRTALGVATFKVDGIELSFSDLKNDALYAIKKGAAKVSEAGVNFDSTLKRWVTTISADFDAWGHQVLAVTIEGLQDAAHVFHSVINRLEGVLTDVIDWLKAHVLKLLADTVTLAARYDGWLLQVSDELYTLTQKAQATTDNGESKALAWLQGKEDELRAALTQIETVLVSKTISDFTGPQKFSAKLNAGPQPTPQQPTSANANWLLEKVTQAGPSPTTTPSVDAALDDLIKQTEVKVAAVGQDFIKAANDFRDALASLVSNPKDFGTVGINKVISAIGEVIHAGLDAADGVIDVMLGLVAVDLQGDSQHAAERSAAARPAAQGRGHDHADHDRLTGHAAGVLSHRARLQAGPPRHRRPPVQERQHHAPADDERGRRSQLRDLRGDLVLGADGHDCGGHRLRRERSSGLLQLGRHRRTRGDQRAHRPGPRRRPSVHVGDQARRQRGRLQRGGLGGRRAARRILGDLLLRRREVHPGGCRRRHREHAVPDLTERVRRGRVRRCRRLVPQLQPSRRGTSRGDRRARKHVRDARLRPREGSGGQHRWALGAPGRADRGLLHLGRLGH
jgi:hypothetical protein